MNFKIKTYCQAHKRQNEISFLWSFDIEKLFPQQYLHFFLPFHFSLETLYRLSRRRENHNFLPQFFSQSGKSSLKPCWPSWIIPSSPSQCQSHFLLKQKPPSVVPRIWAEVVLFVPLPIPLQLLSSIHHANFILKWQYTAHLRSFKRQSKRLLENNFPFFPRISFQSFFSSICGNVPHCFRTVHNTITTNFYIHSATKTRVALLQFLLISMRFCNWFSSAVEYLLFLHYCGTYQSCRVACSAVPGRDTFIYHNNRDNSIPAQS